MTKPIACAYHISVPPYTHGATDCGLDSAGDDLFTSENK